MRIRWIRAPVNHSLAGGSGLGGSGGAWSSLSVRAATQKGHGHSAGFGASAMVFIPWSSQARKLPVNIFQNLFHAV